VSFQYDCADSRLQTQIEYYYLPSFKVGAIVNHWTFWTVALYRS